MKKSLSMFLVTALVLLLCACEGDSSGEVEKSSESKSSNSSSSSSVSSSSAGQQPDPIVPDVELTEEEQIKADLENIVSENYASTDVTEITLNENLGTDDEADYVALVYLTWNVKNKPDTTKQMLAMYSEDFVARVGQDIQAITDFSIFWTVPYYSETETAAKYSYERKDGGMYQSDSMISNVIA